MGVYDRQVATAKRLIAKYGELVTWNSYGASVPEDPAEPWNPTDIEPDKHTVRVAFFPTGSSISQLIRFMKNGDIETGNELGYMAQVPFVPSGKDTLTRTDGSEYRIKNIDPIDPNGEGVILYTVEFQE
uniref:Head-tail joining protein n=1 Tax=Pseudomonas phage Pavpe01 TaxID=3138545 RepID=A0AAU6W1F2_9VIRU